MAVSGTCRKNYGLLYLDDSNISTLMPISRVKRYHKYDTSFKICFLKGTLRTEERKQVPKSTAAYWKKKNAADYLSPKDEKEISFTSYQLLQEENELLKKRIEALTKVVHAFQISNGNESNLLYASSENIAVFIDCIEKVKNTFSLSEGLHLTGISLQQYYAWKNRLDCKSSYLKLCRKKYPSQLTDAEVAVIKKYLTNPLYQFWSRASVYWQMLRDGAAHFAKSTFYKYCNLLGFGKRPVQEKCKKNKEGIISNAPAEVLHTDVTRVTIDDGKTSHICFLQDNYSRFILAGEVAATADAALSTKTIRQGLTNYNLLERNMQLITDDGSENKGSLMAFLQNEASLVKKITARIDIPFANNIVEALHKKIKDQVLQGRRFTDINSLRAYLKEAIDIYNSMPHDFLFGYTPLEVWNGTIPQKGRFASKIKDATTLRKKSNQQLKCCIAT
jgi:putative transposase